MKLLKIILILLLGVGVADIGLASKKKNKKKKATKTEEVKADKAKKGKKAAPMNEGEELAIEAQDNPDEQMVTEGYPWGMAGCGLGSRVFKRNTKGSQLGAAMLNGVTLASSSVTSSKGLSNCDKGPDLRMAMIEAQVFMDVNYVQIKKDAAQGGGSHLTSFYQILGCDAASQIELANKTQSKYNEIFAEDASDAANALRHLALKEYGASCPRAGEA